MKDRRILIVSLVFFVALGISCKDIGNEATGPPESGLIPAAIGNKWVYLDTYATQNVHRTTLDSTVIHSVKTIDGHLWWEPTHGSMGPDATTFLFPVFRNDAGRVLARRTDSYGSVPYLSVVFITPTPIETEYSITFGGDAAALYKARLCLDTLLTNVGAFSPYALYYNGPWEADSIFLVPELGVVKRVRHGEPYSTFTLTSDLVRYNLFH
jgi:hypothetical protein